ncbi:MAG TPA: recombinase family protein [Thermoanaerobaculia bacterium]
MRVALYARLSADLGREAFAPTLADLAAQAARRGWEVVLECTDPISFPNEPRPGLARLREAVRAKAIQGILVHTLSHLARSLRHLTDLGCLLAAHDVALIAIKDHLDTTDPGGAIRWRDWLETSARFNRAQRAEAAKLARLRGTPWGRPRLAVNPRELLIYWEGHRGRRPLSQREIAAKLGIAEATVRSRLHELRAAGEIDDAARARALAARGGLPKGGRPANPLDDADLTAAWEARLQATQGRNTGPSLTAIARHLHVSRRRVRSRLQELGLLSQQQDAPASVRSPTNPATPSEVPNA